MSASTTKQTAAVSCGGAFFAKVLDMSCSLFQECYQAALIRKDGEVKP